MRILVTGGAGYIGSFMTKRLIDGGHEVVVFDSLERGYRDAVDKRAALIQGDLKSAAICEDLFCKETIDAVMHFAGYISVEESMRNPQMYYQNNIVGSEHLFTAAINIGNVHTFIFSSSAAVYGNPKKIPIPENHSKDPTSFYGKTKLATEEMLLSLRKENPIDFACLRYFNAAGASHDASLGENHNPETHIIPLAIKAAFEHSEFSLYGQDYKTPDGTAIRDYIHVLDLVEAHVLALEKLRRDGGGVFYNVGTGKGYSNKDVVDMVKKVSGVGFKVKIVERRPGDAEVLIADPTKINQELGFSPKYSDLETIVESAWKWHVVKDSKLNLDQDGVKTQSSK